MQIILPLKSSITGAYEFHIASKARQKYGFDEAIFSINGNAILGNLNAARRFAQRMNAKLPPTAPTVRASQINAMGLIDEILHLVVGLYRQKINPQIMAAALTWLDSRIGLVEVDKTMRTFLIQFPPIAIYEGQQSLEEYYQGATKGVPNRQIILEELILLWLANVNPAFNPYQELFDASSLSQQTPYLSMIEEVNAFFNYQPYFGPQNQQLIAMLRSPAIAHPDSLSAQLAYIRTHWGDLLGDFLLRLLTGLDLIQEEEKAIFAGPGTVEPYDFSAWGLGEAPERFSEDSDWMPRLVLLAKNAFVWLDQLSKQYHRSITRLDQIPDEELDRIARQGITGLWLIGIWQRSSASRVIKQMMGDPEAIASAYSLLDYSVAQELGGDQAVTYLRYRAIQRGIRLGGDMVPNHMGIDSRWVIEHPHWFLSLDYSPFPDYTFNGPNLSHRQDVGIYLEDHYYSRSDAAVVFKRVDFYSGEEKYIYHGNDGTNMPWNDTAQLNFTLPEVREGVIQTILHVARQFPIIRFDAAMTLAKKHIQRLWFPVPGSGGDIASRAGHGLTQEEFDRAIPVEFWREVVDRVAQESPDTLLLAEAFWMMEGYFVRTLGMHRVYNSAFMHMLRDEHNSKYRQLIKNTLEFNPEILKRYVNFMNNPDEETAVEQFGKGDKYFGVATMMATMPGLPMVGHGQVEGLSEKYGMEYKRAKWEEKPDQTLIDRHARQIFPLFHRRRQFAEVENFLLYDFFTQSGYVNEDVFAYSNILGDQTSLVIYHNRFGDTRGWIKTSSAYSVPTGSNGDRHLIQRELGEGLQLPKDPNAYIVFRNYVTGQEYLRNCLEIHEQGLFLELYAYQTYVFLDFRIVHDGYDQRYSKLASYLGGKGVPDLEEALQEMFLEVIHTPYRELVNAGMLNFLIDSTLIRSGSGHSTPLDQVEQKSTSLLRAISNFTHSPSDVVSIAQQVRKLASELMELPDLRKRYSIPRSRKFQELLIWLESRLPEETSDRFQWAILYIWAFTIKLGQVIEQDESSLTSQVWLDEWLLRKVIRQALQDMGADAGSAEFGVNLVRLLIGQTGWQQIKTSKKAKPAKLMRIWLQDPNIRAFLQINVYQDKTWFNLEALDSWLWWMLAIAILDELSNPEFDPAQMNKNLISCYEILNTIRTAISESEYQIDKLLEVLDE